MWRGCHPAVPVRCVTTRGRSGALSAASLSVGANAVSALLTAASTVIAIRQLPPEDWSLVAVLVGLGVFLGQGLSFGSSTREVRTLSMQGGEGAQFELFSSYVWRRIPLALAIAAASGVAGFAAQSPEAAVVGAMAATIFLNLGALGLITAQKRFVSYGLITVAEGLSVLLVMLLSLRHDAASPLLLPAAKAAGTLLSAASALAVSGAFNGGGKRMSAGGRTCLQLWRGATPFGIATLAPMLLSFDVALVALVAGSYEAGLYAVGSRLTSPLAVAGQALAVVVIPFASGKRLVRPTVRKGMPLIAALLGLGLAFGLLAASASLWVPRAFGSEYSDAVTPVRLYVVAAYLSLLSRPLGAILQAQGLERRVASLSVIRSGFGLSCIAVGALLAGASGGATGAVVLNVLFVMTLFRMLSRIITAEPDRQARP